MPMSRPISSASSMCWKAAATTAAGTCSMRRSSSVYGANTRDAVPHRGQCRPSAQPVRRDQEGERADGACLCASVRLPATGLRFFTVYGPWGRPDMAMWLFTDAILRGRADQAVQPRPYAARLHLYRRRGRSDGAPGRHARRRRTRPGRATRPIRPPARRPGTSTISATTVRSSIMDVVRPDRAGDRQAGKRANCCRCSRATFPETYADVDDLSARSASGPPHRSPTAFARFRRLVPAGLLQNAVGRPCNSLI